MNRSNSRFHTLYPVILAVPDAIHDMKPKERVVFLSRYARQALKLAAEKTGVDLGELKKDENGVPLPSGGNYWSISHKTRYVCGVVAPQPTGIDIERVREISEGLFEKTATAAEWTLADLKADPVMTFFRFWTAKEAVLKATGVGIKDLLKCRVDRILDEIQLQIRYGGQIWLIEHFIIDEHVASIVKSSFQINWTVYS